MSQLIFSTPNTPFMPSATTRNRWPAFMPGISTGLGTPNTLVTTSWRLLVAQPTRFVDKSVVRRHVAIHGHQLVDHAAARVDEECARSLRLEPQIQAAAPDQIAVIGLMQIGAPKHVVSEMISDRAGAD